MVLGNEDEETFDEAGEHFDEADEHASRLAIHEGISPADIELDSMPVTDGTGTGDGDLSDWIQVDLDDSEEHDTDVLGDA